MRLFRRRCFVVRLGTILALVLLPMAPASVSGSCVWEFGGACPYPIWNYGTVYMDCQCDDYGCSLPGPPSYVCVSLPCIDSTVFSVFCILPGDSHTSCHSIMDTSIGCPCDRFACLFDS